MKVTLCAHCGHTRKEHPVIYYGEEVEKWGEGTCSYDCEKFIRDDGMYLIEFVKLPLPVYGTNIVVAWEKGCFANDLGFNQNAEGMEQAIEAHEKGWD